MAKTSVVILCLCLWHACHFRSDLVSQKGDSTEVSRLFYNKQLIVVVAGQVVDSSARKQLQGKVEADGWQVWLPDGSGLALGDACFKGCSKGFEGLSHINGRNSPCPAPALPPIQAQSSSSCVNRHAFQLPVCKQRLLSRPSMGGSMLKLGWR